MFSAQTTRQFVQLIVASIIVLAATLTARGSAPLTLPHAPDSTSHVRSMLLAADDFTNGIRLPIDGTVKAAVAM